MGKDGALCLKDGELFRENGYDVEAVDRIGAGDAFDAAFTLLLLEKKDAGLALRYAVAAAAIAHTIKGDVFYASRDEIEEVLGLRERCFR
jgi:2-dehydro-3-deoxygluconokinase